MKAYLTSFWLLLLTLILVVVGIVILEDLKRKWAIIDPDAGVIDDDDFYTKIGQGWHQMDLGAFSISTPERYLFRQRQGIDSYVGEITDGESIIYFDYGWYSGNLDGRNPETNEGSRDTICGISAYFVRPIGKGTGNSAAHFANVKGDNELTLYADQQMNSALFIRIMLTIRFPGCQEEVELDSELPLFSQASVPAGKFLFEVCGACHKVKGTLVGPGLGDVSEDRFKEWYWADPAPADSLHKSLGPGSHRANWSLEQDELEDLLEYVHQYKAPGPIPAY